MRRNLIALVFLIIVIILVAGIYYYTSKSKLSNNPGLSQFRGHLV